MASAARLERVRMMGKYRAAGIFKGGGKCECGREGLPRLVDLRDPGTVYWECHVCRARKEWCRRRGEEFEVKRVSEAEMERRREGGERLRRWNEERRRRAEGGEGLGELGKAGSL